MTDRYPNRLAAAAVGAVVAAASAPAAALDSFFVGARSQGMAGSLTAATDDVDAQYYNPAAYGFFGKDDADGQPLYNDNNQLHEKNFGIGVDVGAGMRVHGELYNYADRLSNEDLDTYETIDNQTEAANFVGLLGDLSGIDDPQNGLLVDANGGMGMRFALPWAWAPQGVGARTYNQVGFRGQLDRQNLGDANTARDLYNEFNNNDITGDNNLDKLNSEQDKAIRDSLVNSGLNENEAEEVSNAIDDALRDSGEDITKDQVDKAVGLLSDIYGDGSYTAGALTAGTDSLSNNESALVVQGVSVQEVPITWAWSFEDMAYVGGSWSVGTNVKLMRGDVFAKSIRVFDDNNDVGDQVDEAWNNRETTNTVGVDVGVMGRYDMLNVGLMARNLNSPTFEGPSYIDSSGAKVDVDNVSAGPQVRAGVAFMPFSTLTVEGDVDLTRNQTMLDEYETQFASVGFEWDALSVLALRAGAYKNLADDDIGNVYTAGLGLNLWLARIDLGAAVSAERETVDGDELPTEARANLEVTLDW